MSEIVTRSATSSSVARAFELLDLVAAAPDGIALGQLAAAVPTAKSTTHRYVMTLLDLGALRRDARGRLTLGLKLVELAGALLDGDDLHAAADPVLHELVAQTGETVHLGIPSDGHVVYVAKVESPQSVRLVSRVGARVALHCSAMGKALMARMGEESLDAALAHPRTSRTVHTIVDETAMRAELEKVRVAGVAIDDEENELGVRCLGAVIVDPRAGSLGAISVSAPAARMSHERCAEVAPAVISAAEEIARRLGRPIPRSHEES
ncbi:MAG TPA: IclR family transcriptional regulator [Conexibacter sp.]|jgi:IclR family acetate operon transcriptional repressor